jgi:hypothetical protein
VDHKNAYSTRNGISILFLAEATFTEQMLPMLMPPNIIQFYVEALEEKQRNFRSSFPGERS